MTSQNEASLISWEKIIYIHLNQRRQLCKFLQNLESFKFRMHIKSYYLLNYYN